MQPDEVQRNVVPPASGPFVKGPSSGLSLTLMRLESRIESDPCRDKIQPIAALSAKADQSNTVSGGASELALRPPHSQCFCIVWSSRLLPATDYTCVLVPESSFVGAPCALGIGDYYSAVWRPLPPFILVKYRPIRGLLGGMTASAFGAPPGPVTGTRAAQP